MSPRPLVIFLRGTDESLLREAVRRTVDQLVGEQDRSLLVDELDGDADDLSPAVDAARTRPFFTDYRVVVVRGVDRFTTAQLTPLLAYLADPEDFTSLVLVWNPGGGRVPKALNDALKGAGAVVEDASAPTGKARSTWLDAQLQGSGLRFDAAAKRSLVAHVGEDVSRLAGLVATLEAAHGPGARLSEADVAPFLGEAGSVPPWELTDAIDDGNVPLAVERVRRMLGAGGRHPLQVMVTLQSHFERILRLHGAAVADERAAAQLLGLKGSTFPARKALNRARALGGPRIQSCIELLADADEGLRGGSGWPDDQTMEVLVARLARLSKAGR